MPVASHACIRAYYEVSFLGWHGARKFMMRASANSATKQLLWDPKGSVVASDANAPRRRVDEIN